MSEKAANRESLLSRAQRLSKRLELTTLPKEPGNKIAPDQMTAQEFLLAKKELMAVLKARNSARRDRAEALAKRLDQAGSLEVASKPLEARVRATAKPAKEVLKKIPRVSAGKQGAVSIAKG